MFTKGMIYYGVGEVTQSIMVEDEMKIILYYLLIFYFKTKLKLENKIFNRHTPYIYLLKQN